MDARTEALRSTTEVFERRFAAELVEASLTACLRLLAKRSGSVGAFHADLGRYVRGEKRGGERLSRELSNPELTAGTYHALLKVRLDLARIATGLTRPELCRPLQPVAFPAVLDALFRRVALKFTWAVHLFEAAGADTRRQFENMASARALVREAVSEQVAADLPLPGSDAYLLDPARLQAADLLQDAQTQQIVERVLQATGARQDRLERALTELMAREAVPAPVAQPAPVAAPAPVTQPAPVARHEERAYHDVPPPNDGEAEEEDEEDEEDDEDGEDDGDDGDDKEDEDTVEEEEDGADDDDAALPGGSDHGSASARVASPPRDDSPRPAPARDGDAAAEQRRQWQAWRRQSQAAGAGPGLARSGAATEAAADRAVAELMQTLSLP